MIWLSKFFINLLNLAVRLLGRQPVTNVDTDEVVCLIERSGKPVVLVDVRSPDEIAVSKIPGAITRAEFEMRREQLTNHTVIAYCTVGGRSFMFASRYSQTGLKVYNYRGSILAWCGSGRPLVAPDGSATSRVHTYTRLLRAPEGYQQTN